MDSVQLFIRNNQYQLGYIMSEASRVWIENDPVGALTVGDCNFVVEKYGKYHELLEQLQKWENYANIIKNSIDSYKQESIDNYSKYLSLKNEVDNSNLEYLWWIEKNYASLIFENASLLEFKEIVEKYLTSEQLEKIEDERENKYAE